MTERIDVWFANLDTVAASRGERLGSLLSSDEGARARRQSDAVSRRRFVAGREMLRLILGRQCGIDPADVVIEHGPNGKPSVTDDRGTFFSVAHSDELSVVAVTRVGEIGIDVERIRDGVDIERIALRIFSKPDVQPWAALPDGERARAFFDAWVRREALVKGTGIGLLPWWKSRAALPIRSTGGRSDIDPDEVRGWKVCMFSPSPDSTGCVAVRGQHQIGVRLRSLQQLA